MIPATMKNSYLFVIHNATIHDLSKWPSQLITKNNKTNIRTQGKNIKLTITVN
jgi:hypothetical protein